MSMQPFNNNHNNNKNRNNNNNNYNNPSSNTQQQQPIYPQPQSWPGTQQQHNTSAAGGGLPLLPPPGADMSQQQQQYHQQMQLGLPPPQMPLQSTGPVMPYPPPSGVYMDFPHHTGNCPCAGCELASRYAVVYQKQFPAMTPMGTEQNKIERAIQANRTNHPCQMWDAYGFCFHGLTCMFPHAGSTSNADQMKKSPSSQEQHQQSSSSTKVAPRPKRIYDAGKTASLSVKEITKEIETMCDEQASGKFNCRVCGYNEVFDASCIIKVGEMFSYMTCPRCTSPLYQPYMLQLVEAALRETGGKDHAAYKDLLDRLRQELPHMVRIPLMFEGHRLASTYFAWSLVSPKDAEEALRAAIGETPLKDATGVVSMGAGTGYAEHVFAQALESMIKEEQGAEGEKQRDCPLNKENRKSFSVLAFDEILRESRFSVPVQFGTPDMLNCIPDVKKMILLLCWPPFGSPGGPTATMGFDCLKRFVELGGESVIYIGDVASTGDYDMHLLLQHQFRPVATYRTRHELRRWIPQEMGLVFAGNDTIGVYKKRDKGDEFMYFAH